MHKTAPNWSAPASVLDTGRGLAIVAIVYGHALAPWFIASADSPSLAAFLQWKFGAAFIIPFFFFLSGLAWRSERALAATLRQSGTLILIACLASLAMNAFVLAASWAGWAEALVQPGLDAKGFARDALRMVVYGDGYAMSALWFLVALATVRIVAAFGMRLGHAALTALALALFALSLAAIDLGWRNFYQIYALGVGLVAFLAGHAARGFVAQLERLPRAALALALLAGLATLATFHLNDGCRWDFAAQCGQGWLNDRFGVSMIAGQLGNIPLFVLTAATGTAFALALSALIARFGGVVGAQFAVWGRASLDLLIVNCLFLEFANPLIEAWLAPRVAADTPLFFAALFAATLALNLLALRALRTPLHALRRLAHGLAGAGVDAGARLAAIVAQRRVRVTQGHD